MGGGVIYIIGKNNYPNTMIMLCVALPPFLHLYEYSSVDPLALLNELKCVYLGGNQNEHKSRHFQPNAPTVKYIDFKLSHLDRDYYMLYLTTG